jgi:hypothetical protein
MEVYKDSKVDLDEFDFENIIPYFKQPFERTRSKYESLMDPLSDKIQHLPEDKRKMYTKFMVNIIAHLSALSRIIEKEIKNLNIPHSDFESDFEINYIRN